MTTPKPTRILFVCLGNICRSPMAEAILRHEANQRGMRAQVEIQSCGTGSWHIGDNADPRTIAACQARGVPINHIARQINAPADFNRFDLLIAMDDNNRRNLLALGCPPAKLKLMRSYDPKFKASAEVPPVPDPYTGTASDFDDVFDMLTTSCRALLDELASAHSD